MYDLIIVGAGFAGAVTAQQAAADSKRVLVLDKRDHLGGNSYDEKNEIGIRIHTYGPHLFHTNSREVNDYVHSFIETFPYEHRVRGYVDGKFVPIPFSIKTIEELFPKEKAEEIIDTLVSEYGREKKVPILKLKESSSNEVRELADYIYEKVFKYYTMKQWGVLPEEIDPAVTKRVPVFLSLDERYFQDEFQFMPKNGYTELFEKLLDHENITVELNCEALNRVELVDGSILFDGKSFDGELVYTGCIEELFGYQYGELPYRSLEFTWENHHVDSFQVCSTVNYPTPASQHPFTRITEFKKCTMEENVVGKTTTVTEVALPYDRNGAKGNIPYYPILNDENRATYEQYVKSAERYSHLHLIGRLAEYKYYNMDMVVLRALRYYEDVLKESE